MPFGYAYLTQPALEEAALPARCWGSDALVMDLAGGFYEISGLTSSQAMQIWQRFRTRPPSGAVATERVSITLYRLPREVFREIDMHGWEYTFDRHYQPEHLRLAGLDFIAQIDFFPKLGCRLWTSRDDPAGFTLAFENVLRVLVAYGVAQAGGVLLHSAAFARDGRAQVVVGYSGAGKSTCAGFALSQGWEVLSDDMNALLPTPTGWRVERLPFAGDLGQTPGRGFSYPVAGLYWLRQAGRHALSPLPSALAVARLLACAPIVNEDPYRVKGLLDNLVALSTPIPMGTLDFRRNADFLSLL